LTCTDCVSVSGVLTETTVAEGISVPLSWTPPGFGVFSQYTVWRGTGSFPTAALVAANITSFHNIATVSGAPPAATFADGTVSNGQIYTYFITDQNSTGVVSGPSSPLVVTVAVPPSGLTCTNCTNLDGVITEKATKSVPLSWTAASPSLAGQFTVLRAPGSFPTLASVNSNMSAFVIVGTTPAPPFTDNPVPFANNTYTYIVTESFSPTGVKTGPSAPLVVNVVCDLDNDNDDDCAVPDIGLLSVLRPPSILLRGSPAKGSILADESLRTSLGLDLLP